MLDCFCQSPRTLACRIVLLDERELVHEIQDNSTGQALLDVVIRHLDLLETAYFGLRFIDQDNQAHWLESSKRLKRQLKPGDQHTFYFGVKFYATDPCKLLEEITRYQVFLQVKQDVLRGRLPVSFELAAELAAFVLQSELGDYDQRRHSPGYVSEFRFLANQSAELEARAAEIHKTLKGIAPAAAELSYLDKVKWLDMYGVDLHPVLGEDSVEYFLGLAPSGLLLLRGKHTVANYYWPRITKLYYKGRYFMLKVADKNNDQSTYGFECPSRSACRHLWRCCSDHHAFFRMQQVSPAAADIFALGARFSGRNERHTSRPRTPPTFTRTPSRRYSRVQNTSLHDISSKFEELRTRDIVEVKQPTSVQRPNSYYSYRANGVYPTITENRYHSGTINDRYPPSKEVRYQSGSSPRSTRSAPLGRGLTSRTGVTRRGLYSGSPPSARSVPTRPPMVPRGRSASVDSQSSNDSRSIRKHRHRSRRQSDAESEMSRGSGRSGRKHRRQRSRHKHRDSGSERDDRSASRTHSKEYQLVDSGSQWKEVQRQQAAAAGNAVQVASVRKSQPENETSTQRSSSHRHRKHKKHRSRSGSPNEKSWLTSELKQHLEYQLVDTTGMSEAQLREIPYTVVQTNKIRQAKLKSSRHTQNDNAVNNNGPLIPQVHNKIYLDNLNANQGSIRSGSSTISSVRTGSDKHLPSRKSDHSLNNIINGNVPYLVSPLMSPMAKTTLSSRPSNNNSNSSSGELASSKLSHEHTDSGLGGDHDLAYSSERSSDSAKNQPARSNWDPSPGRCASAASDTRLYSRGHPQQNLVPGKLKIESGKPQNEKIPNGAERKKSTTELSEMSTEL